MKEAISKAIEGGYPWKGRGRLKIGAGREYQILLDPLFWSSLGKALGWRETIIPMWIQKWHDFIDHLAEGKNAESFFTALLTNRN